MFVELYDSLVEVVEIDGSTVRMNKSAGFAQQVTRFSVSKIDFVAFELQKRGATLSDY